jgi:MFS family permease
MRETIWGSYLKMDEEKPKMPRAIWALGMVSLFMDTSSEIVHGLLPVFLISTLGANYTFVGIIEGFGEATALMVKVFSGPLSDWWGKRKPLVLLGYSMGALSKPLFAIAGTPWLIFGARLFDRTGKGIRGAPRDAMVADIAPASLRGAAFGLRQALDTVGAFIGPLIAILLMYLTHGNFRLIFWLAVIPGLISVLIILASVREPEKKIANAEKNVSFEVVRKFSATFWIVTSAGAIFQMARFSEAFLILRAQNLGLAISLAPVILVAMNVVYSVSAYPIGKISDRIPRIWMVLAGFLTLALSDFVLGLGNNLIYLFTAVVLWGLHLGLTQGTLAALVADHSPAQFRGTAYGVFNLFSAISLLFASVGAGILWDNFGPQTTFFASGGLAILGFFLLALVPRYFSADKVSG